MRKVFIMLMLVSACSTKPNDFIGKNIDEVMSEYGDPAAAYDSDGARVFIFEPEKQNNGSDKAVFNPDMWQSGGVSATDCYYAFHTIWTNAKKDWTVHGATTSAKCNKEQN